MPAFNREVNSTPPTPARNPAIAYTDTSIALTGTPARRADSAFEPMA